MRPSVVSMYPGVLRGSISRRPSFATSPHGRGLAREPPCVPAVVEPSPILEHQWGWANAFVGLSPFLDTQFYRPRPVLLALQRRTCAELGRRVGHDLPEGHSMAAFPGAEEWRVIDESDALLRQPIVGWRRRHFQRCPSTGQCRVAWPCRAQDEEAHTRARELAGRRWGRSARDDGNHGGV